MESITVEYLKLKGFKELGNDLGAAHYRIDGKKHNSLIEIRHTQDNNRWWLTDGKSSYTIQRELFKREEVQSLMDFLCISSNSNE